MGDVADDSPCEGERLDCKSLRVVTGRAADFADLAHDCVAFANGSGGRIVVGIEDRQAHPSAGQRIEPGLLDRISKRVGELTVNVRVLPELPSFGGTRTAGSTSS